MKLNMKGLSRRCQHSLALGAGFFPLTVWIAASSMQAVYPALPLFAAVYALAALACLLLPGKWRIAAAVAAAALLTGIAFLVLPAKEAPVLLWIPVLYAVLLFVSLPVSLFPCLPAAKP